MRLRLAALVAALLLAAPAAAQPATPASVPPVPDGTRLRVRTADNREVIGTLDGVRGDTLLLRAADVAAASDAPLRLTGVRRVDISGGRRTRYEGAWRGGLVGLLVGGLPTVTVVAVTYDQERRNPTDSYISGTAVAALLGAALTVTTTTVGAVIGYNRPGERWARAELLRRVGAAPTRDGVAVAMRVKF